MAKFKKIKDFKELRLYRRSDVPFIYFVADHDNACFGEIYQWVRDNIDGVVFFWCGAEGGFPRYHLVLPNPESIVAFKLAFGDKNLLY